MESIKCVYCNTEYSLVNTPVNCINCSKLITDNEKDKRRKESRSPQGILISIISMVMYGIMKILVGDVGLVFGFAILFIVVGFTTLIILSGWDYIKYRKEPAISPLNLKDK
ncbi:MAG: hypothetical protein J0M03_02870 [Acidobacteria bacterium]|nr:hypothetical protein [Acidobacteriota bacterium]